MLISKLTHGKNGCWAGLDADVHAEAKRLAGGRRGKHIVTVRVFMGVNMGTIERAHRRMAPSLPNNNT